MAQLYHNLIASQSANNVTLQNQAFSEKPASISHIPKKYIEAESRSSNHAWEELEPEVTRLVLEQSFGPSDIKEHFNMKNPPFIANKRQWERRLKKWGLHTNLSAEKKRRMIKIRIQRKRNGKETEFHFKSRKNPKNLTPKLDRFLKDKPEEACLFDSMQTPSNISDITVFTPRDTPLPESPHTIGETETPYDPLRKYGISNEMSDLDISRPLDNHSSTHHSPSPMIHNSKDALNHPISSLSPNIPTTGAYLDFVLNYTNPLSNYSTSITHTPYFLDQNLRGKLSNTLNDIQVPEVQNINLSKTIGSIESFAAIDRRNWSSQHSQNEAMELNTTQEYSCEQGSARPDPENNHVNEHEMFGDYLAIRSIQSLQEYLKAEAEVEEEHQSVLTDIGDLLYLLRQPRNDNSARSVVVFTSHILEASMKLSRKNQEQVLRGLSHYCIFQGRHADISSTRTLAFEILRLAKVWSKKHYGHILCTMGPYCEILLRHGEGDSAKKLVRWILEESRDLSDEDRRNVLKSTWDYYGYALLKQGDINSVKMVVLQILDGSMTLFGYDQGKVIEDLVKHLDELDIDSAAELALQLQEADKDYLQQNLAGVSVAIALSRCLCRQGRYTDSERLAQPVVMALESWLDDDRLLFSGYRILKDASFGSQKFLTSFRWFLEMFKVQMRQEDHLDWDDQNLEWMVIISALLRQHSTDVVVMGYHKILKILGSYSAEHSGLNHFKHNLTMDLVGVLKRQGYLDEALEVLAANKTVIINCGEPESLKRELIMDCPYHDALLHLKKGNKNEGRRLLRNLIKTAEEMAYDSLSSS